MANWFEHRVIGSTINSVEAVILSGTDYQVKPSDSLTALLEVFNFSIWMFVLLGFVALLALLVFQNQKNNKLCILIPKYAVQLLNCVSGASFQANLMLNSLLFLTWTIFLLLFFSLLLNGMSVNQVLSDVKLVDSLHDVIKLNRTIQVDKRSAMWNFIDKAQPNSFLQTLQSLVRSDDSYFSFKNFLLVL